MAEIGRMQPVRADLPGHPGDADPQFIATALDAWPRRTRDHVDIPANATTHLPVLLDHASWAAKPGVEVAEPPDPARLAAIATAIGKADLSHATTAEYLALVQTITNRDGEH